MNRGYSKVHIAFQVRSQPLSRCLSRLYSLGTVVSPLVFRFISAPDQSNVPVLSCPVDRGWGPSRAILLLEQRLRNGLNRISGSGSRAEYESDETRRNAFGWAGPSYTSLQSDLSCLTVQRYYILINTTYSDHSESTCRRYHFGT